MLALQEKQVSQVTSMRFVFSDVRRINDWFVRECPECHQQGYVSVYPNRENEALNFILRSDWLCKSCAEIRCEVERNVYARGGDALGN